MKEANRLEWRETRKDRVEILKKRRKRKKIKVWLIRISLLVSFPLVITLFMYNIFLPPSPISPKDLSLLNQIRAGFLIFMVLLAIRGSYLKDVSLPKSFKSTWKGYALVMVYGSLFVSAIEVLGGLYGLADPNLKPHQQRALAFSALLASFLMGVAVYYVIKEEGRKERRKR